MKKRWFRSKTILTGIAEEIIGAVLTGIERIESGDWSTTGIALLITGLLTIILRKVTTAPIE